MAHFDVDDDNYLKRWERTTQSHLFLNKGIKECSPDKLPLCIYCVNVSKAKMGYMYFADSWSDINTVFQPIPLCKLSKWRALWASACTLATNYSIGHCSGLLTTDWIPVCIFRAWLSLPSVQSTIWLRSIFQRWSYECHNSSGWA